MTHLLVVAALVVIPLAQIPLVAYLARHVELRPGEERPPPGRGYVTYGTASGEPDVALDPGVCPHCDSPVDAEYDYCGQCAGSLTVHRGGPR